MIEPYLSLGGNAAEAAAYYAGVFDAPEPYVMRYGEIPPGEMEEVPPEAAQLVMHANVKTYGGDLMLADAMPGSDTTPSAGMWITLSHTDQNRLRETFERLSREGEVLSPLEPSFFSPLYGQLRDKYGFFWMLMSPEEP
ncbi:MAG: VOC family protein [Clostridiales bacterium]|nr:VOC family protein [Clostridiales bacterium]